MAYTIRNIVSCGSYWSGSTNSSTDKKNQFSSNMSKLSKEHSIIQSGAYKKLLVKHYEMQNDSSSETTKTELSEEKKLAQINLYADAVSSGVKKIWASDDVTEAVKSFVDSYNEMVTATADVDNTKVLQQGVKLVNSTKVYRSTLKRVGITVNSDNTLSVDEEALAKASKSDIKLLFKDNNSFGSKVAKHASLISNYAKKSALYTVSGNYSNSTTNLFSTYY